MKLLISAYACAPNRGSEHGSAWNWTCEVARLGEDVTVLVSPAHRDAVLSAAQRDPALQRIRWLFPEVAFWPLQQGKEPVWERTYNLLWQREALPLAQALHREQPFDLVHHLTWGGVRAPTFLGTLGAPLIIGPVGGGETSPAGLRDRYTIAWPSSRKCARLVECNNRTEPNRPPGSAQGRSDFRPHRRHQEPAEPAIAR